VTFGVVASVGPWSGTLECEGGAVNSWSVTALLEGPRTAK